MVIYEVNLKVSDDVVDDFRTWLTPHIEEILKFDGFKSAKYLNEKRADEEGFQKITIQYTINSIENLDKYFENHAQRMREDGLTKFPGKFSATRRIFDVAKEFTD